MPMSAQSSSRAMAPQSITLPPPPTFSTFAVRTSSGPDASPSTPLESAMHFYTAPSSPITPPVQWFTPPSTPQTDAVPSHTAAAEPVDVMPVSAPILVPHAAQPSPEPASVASGVSSEMPITDDAFPSAVLDLVMDLGLAEDSLTPLEKIYLYSRSESSTYRLFIAGNMRSFLDHVAPQEALEYVYPLIETLVVDEEEPVKLTLAGELPALIWWFFANCQVFVDDQEPYATSSTTATINVNAFSGIIATLLLSPNLELVKRARLAVAELMVRMRRADDKEGPAPPTHSALEAKLVAQAFTRFQEDEGDDRFVPGLFQREQRDMFRDELLQSVIIGMGRLGIDVDLDSLNSQPATPNGNVGESLLTISTPTEQPKSPLRTVNPYFPSSPPPEDSNPTSPQQYQNDSLTVSSPTRSSPASSTAQSTSSSKGRHRSRRETVEDQIAISQLASTGLIAAVSATGLVPEDILRVFASEVVRAGLDSPRDFVRSEAGMALGALSQVVPDDVIDSHLFPLFSKLWRDSSDTVRIAALYAMPPLLSRLPPKERRAVVLETITAASKDVSTQVQNTLLGALGESIYAFHDDATGPPDELLQMFLGRPEDRDIRTGEPNFPWMPNYKRYDPREYFWNCTDRPYICMYNYPAVTLGLTAARWNQIREVYLELAQNLDGRVQHSLASSLGEMAKILGTEIAENDIIPLWWECVRYREEQVRVRAIEALVMLLEVATQQTRDDILSKTLHLWRDGGFRGWRERVTVMEIVQYFARWCSPSTLEQFKDLVVKGLEDRTAAVREAAVHNVPLVWDALLEKVDLLRSFEDALETFCTSAAYKRRVTFVDCMMSRLQALNASPSPSPSDLKGILISVGRLVDDPVVDVRIGVARLLNVFFDATSPRPLPAQFHTMFNQLTCDRSSQVKEYLPDLELEEERSKPEPPSQLMSDSPPPTFSRPPPRRRGRIGHNHAQDVNMDNLEIPSSVTHSQTAAETAEAPAPAVSLTVPGETVPWIDAALPTTTVGS